MPKYCTVCGEKLNSIDGCSKCKGKVVRNEEINESLQKEDVIVIEFNLKCIFNYLKELFLFIFNVIIFPNFTFNQILHSRIISKFIGVLLLHIICFTWYLTEVEYIYFTAPWISILSTSIGLLILIFILGFILFVSNYFISKSKDISSIVALLIVIQIPLLLAEFMTVFMEMLFSNDMTSILDTGIIFSLIIGYLGYKKINDLNDDKAVIPYSGSIFVFLIIMQLIMH